MSVSLNKSLIPSGRRLAWHILPAAILLSAMNAYSQGTIITVAGTDWLFPAQNLPALSAPLGSVAGIAADGAGNTYLADTSNQMVMKVTPSGQLQVIAGNGLEGFTGDGSPATARSLLNPISLASDQSGNVYVGELSYIFGLGRIRRITPSGSIATVVGGGNDAPAEGLAALNVYLYQPHGLTLDTQGNLYFADLLQVFKVTTDGTIHVIAGNGKSGFSGDGGLATQASMSNPSGVAADSSGNVYVSDYTDDRIRKITTAGIISTVAGTGIDASTGDGGQAVSAALNQPEDVAVDSAGNLYVLQLYGAIRKITANGVINTILATGSLYFPEQFVVEASGTIAIADSADFQAKLLSPSGAISTVAGNGGYRKSANGTPALTAWLESPSSVAVDPSGDVFVSDLYLAYGAIREIRGGQLFTLAGTSGLNTPDQINFDSAGNLYVAEPYNYCEIHKITPSGQISIVAGGHGGCGFSGDGGPALSAQLSTPEGVVVGPDGSIYIADSANERIRKVSPNGIIQTIAGNGVEAYSGDNGPALSASLNYPDGLALDSAGNLYIADAANSVVRKLTPQGIITTVAGNGTSGYTGDGGLATRAELAYPTMLAFDAFENLYISDSDNSVVRKVTPAGIITTFAGNGSYAFTGDGGLATKASLAFPIGIAFDKAGDLFIADWGNSRIREVLAASPSFTALPNTLSFSGTSGGNSSSPLAVTVSGSLPGLAYSATASVPWVSIAPQSGSLPAKLLITANPGQLSAGSYSGTVTISVPNASPSTQTVAVAFTVAASVAPSLSLNSTPLSFAFSVNSGTQQTQQIQVANNGGGSASFTASATTAAGGAWLQITPASSSSSAAAPSVLTITATPGSLGVGTYTGSVTVAGTNTSASFTIPVTMTVNGSQQILISQTGLTFTAVAGGGAVLPQAIGILNTGSGSGAMSWTANVSTLSGSGWLGLSATSGTVTQPLLDVSFVDVTINPQSLSAGNYFGTIQVTAPGAANSPQTVTVILNVLPAGSNPGPEVRPTGLVFTGLAGASGIASQSFMVSDTVGTGQLAYGSSATYLAGSNWVTYLPANAQLAPATPTQIVVQPDFTSLSSNIYRGAITLVFGDGSIRNVSLLGVAAPGSSSLVSSSPTSAQLEPRASGCSQTSMVLEPTSPQQTFTASLGQPTAMEMMLVDNCGNPVTAQAGTAGVLATFSTGDPAVTLVSTQNGKWSGTWQPVKGSAGSTASVTVSAFLITSNGKTLGAQAVMNATLSSGAALPLPQSVKNAASLATTGAVAPGALVSVFGTGLASTVSIAGGAPFPTNLAGTEVNLGGQALPLLYAGNGQVNAQIPYNLVVNTQLQLQVKQGTTLSVPQAVTVATAQPAVFSISQNGSGQGAIVNLSNVVVDGNAPAAIGDAVVIYCTGLGPVSPAVPAGTAAPVLPLSYTTNTVTATIGGQPAQVLFAGLAPTFAGLYQVNAVVPAGVTAGNAVPVVLQVAGQSSPPVTIAVK